MKFKMTTFLTGLGNKIKQKLSKKDIIMDGQTNKVSYRAAFK